MNTLRAIAQQAISGACPTVRSVLDAQRGDLFAATWNHQPQTQPTSYQEMQPTTIINADEWLASLQSGDWVTGPGLEKIDARIRDRANIVDRQYWQPQATTIALIGLEAWQHSEDRSSFDPFTLVPTYYRRTAAEEQWEKRQQAARSHEPERLK